MTDVPGLTGLAAIRSWLFDLDGVVTDTAALHARAWKETFDILLERLASGGAGAAGPGAGASGAGGAPPQLAPFDPVADYDRYVDGRPRRDGVLAFLAARGISLPEGSPDDPPGAPTVRALARDKDARFLKLLATVGVRVFPDARELLGVLAQAGRPKALVSASENTRRVLRAAGLGRAFDTVVDGRLARRLRLAGKPAPDTYLEAARRLATLPAHAAVLEDAISGVTAGRAGGFGLVVGVARRGDPDELASAGAHVVVRELTELLADPRLASSLGAGA